MKIYFKEQPNKGVTLISEHGEGLWQVTNMDDAIKNCRAFPCLNSKINIENNDASYKQHT